MQHLQFAQPDPMQEIVRLSSNIGMEAISMQGIQSALHNFFPALKDNFAKYAANFATAEAPIALKADERKFIEQVMKQQYLNITDLPAYVPEGLSVPYLDYLQVLLQAVDHCEATTMRTLNDYSLMVSQIVTNRSAKAYVPSNAPALKKAEAKLNELNSRLGDCFGKGSTATSVTYGDVVGRNSEWREVILGMNKAMTVISHISRTSLHKKAEDCNFLLDAIIRQIKNGEFETASPEVIKNLGAGAFQAAKELEFFTVTYYKTAALVTAIGDTMRVVGDALAD